MARALEQIEDKYEVLRLLGEGGMGEVYLVRHRLLEDLRVVKIMHSRLQEDSDLKARFLREAKAAVQLKHPNIGHVHDFWIDDSGDAFLVMEYIEGLNLNEVLKRFGAPEYNLAIEIARQSLRALGYLHSKRFVHRDVSPDNLMLTRDVDDRPLIKLIDLGIAKELTADANLTHAGFFVGKVHYASPEQFEPASDGSEIDGRSDIYSFGIVLYLLLTGKYPIQGGSGSALIAGHLLMSPMSFEESDPHHRLPEGLRAILKKALEKDPGDRFATADDFIQALDALSGGGGESPRTTVESTIPATVIQDLTRIREDRMALLTGPTRPMGLGGEALEQTRVLEAVKTLVDSERLDDAEAKLVLVFGKEPSEPTAKLLLTEIVKRRDAMVRGQQALELFREAGELLDKGELEAARDKARESLELESNTSTEVLISTLDRSIERREVEQRQTRDREENQRRILGLLDRGELASAEVAIAALEEGPGNEVDASFYRDRLVTARRLEEVQSCLEEAREALDQKRLGKAREHLEKARALDPRHGSISALEGEIVAVERSLRIELKQEHLAEVAASAAIEAVRHATGGDRESASDHVDDVDHVDDADNAGRPRASRGRRRKLLLTAIGLILTVVFIGLWMRTREVAHESASRAALAQGVYGELVLDAIPWARVVEIRGEAGDLVALDIDDRFTPLVLNLAAGRYEILLENEASGAQNTVLAEITAGEVSRRVVELSSVDVSGYLARIRP